VECLRIVSAGFVLYAYGMVLEQAFNGAGDTMTPTLINLGCFWAVEIPLAWVLAHSLEMGPTGAFLSVTVSYGMLAVVSMLLFRRGRWKLRSV
jgi:Na+-driven multidrug efflux pump